MLALATMSVCCTVWLVAIPARANATIAYVKGGKAIIANDDGTGAATTGLSAHFVELSPDASRLLAFDAERHVLRTRNLLNGVVRRIRTGAAKPNAADWVGNTLVYSTATERFGYVWKVAPGSTTPRAIYRQRRDCEEAGCSYPVLSMAGSPDGLLIAVFGQMRFPVAMIRPSGRAAFRTPQATGDGSYQLVEVAWSRDSSMLAASELMNYRTMNRLSTFTRAGRRTLRLSNAKRGFNGLTWAPDGSAIGYGSTSTDATGSDTSMNIVRFNLATRHSTTLMFDTGRAGDRGLGAWTDAGALLIGDGTRILMYDIATTGESTVARTTGWFDWAPTRT